MRALLALPVRALSSSLALLAERVLPHSVSRRVADCFYRVSDLPAIRGAFSRSAVRHFLGVPAYGGNAGARVAVTGVSVVQREESAESVLLPAHMNTQQENMAALPQPSVFAKPKSDQSTRLDDDRAKELPKDLQVSHALTVSTLAEVTRRKAKRQRKPLVYVKDDRENTDPKEETDPGAPEVIKKISPFVVWKDKSKDADRFDDEYQGYAIKTNKQTIRLLISRWGQCCEKFGVYLNLNKMDTQLSKKKDLIGAYLLSVRWGRDKPDGYKDNFDVFREHRGHACVDIHTDKGKVQLVAYNEHNGWYPHSVVASWGFGDKAYMDKQDI